MSAASARRRSNQVRGGAGSGSGPDQGRDPVLDIGDGQALAEAQAALKKGDGFDSLDYSQLGAGTRVIVT